MTMPWPELLRLKVRKKVSDLRRLGLWGALVKVFHDRVYHVKDVVILERALSRREKRFQRSRAWTCVALERPAQANVFRRNFPEKFRLFRSFLRQRILGVASVVDGDAIAYFWLATQDFYDAAYRYRFQVQPGQVYQFAGKILPKYRNTTVVLDTQELGWEICRARGIQTTFCGVDTANEASMRIHMRLGFTERGEMIRVHRLLGVGWSRHYTYEGSRFEQLAKRRRRS
jgi:RimJ/RimL family protein N-acetyltransferase